jgi:hypothetical protein
MLGAWFDGVPKRSIGFALMSGALMMVTIVLLARSLPA